MSLLLLLKARSTPVSCDVLLAIRTGVGRSAYTLEFPVPALKRWMSFGDELE